MDPSGRAAGGRPAAGFGAVCFASVAAMAVPGANRFQAAIRVTALLVAAGLVSAAACAVPILIPTPRTGPPPYPPRSPSPSTPDREADRRPSAADPASRLLSAVNRERARRDLPPLAFDRRLAAAAESHSRAMAERDFFAHCDLDTGSKVGARAEDAGYPWRGVAENLSVGRDTADEVVAGWMRSRGHRENLLSERYRDAGAGYVHDPGDRRRVRVDDDGDCRTDRRDGPYGHYWTMVFGITRSTAPLPGPPGSP